MWFAESRLLRAALLPDRALLLARGESSAKELPAGEAVPDAAAWRAPLAALQRELATGGHRGARRLSVLLGAAFVRWQLMPWPTGVSSRAELDAAMRMRMRAVHGALVDGWRIQAASVEPGEPVLACAIDTALHTELQQMCRSVGLRLAHLRPYASAVLDRGRALGGREQAWHGVLEPGHLTLCLSERGRLLALRSVRSPADPAGAWASVLPALQAQMAMQSGIEVRSSAPLHLAGPGSERAATVTGLRMRAWDTGADHIGGLARLAMGC